MQAMAAEGNTGVLWTRPVRGKTSLESLKQAALATNEGEMTDDDGETPASAAVRGRAALVTASCPRTYPKDLALRKRQNNMISEDYTTEAFLSHFRRVFDANTAQRLKKASCHDEPHKRMKPDRQRRERRKHIAMQTSGNFGHKRVAEAFYRATGVRISFSFKHESFPGYVSYLMTPGKKAKSDLDLKPAKYPPDLDLEAELRLFHGDDADSSRGKKRKSLSFDDVSNVIMEGIGEGPLCSAKELEAAARHLKSEGNVELWNYLGSFKTVADVRSLVAKVWRMSGKLNHHLFHSTSRRQLADFDFGHLALVREWLEGGWETHTLVLSGDGGLGKTSLAAALVLQVCPSGFWFLDDPDDLREIDGEIQEGQGLVVDEVTLAGLPANQVKKLFDLELARRITCRHFNGFIPAGCPRIYCTNSDEKGFYPQFKCRADGTGVRRRVLFETVERDLRRGASAAGTAASQSQPALPLREQADGSWQDRLHQLMAEARTEHYFERACSVCDDLGVAFFGEVLLNGDDIASRLKMKKLERDRFVQSIAAVRAVG